LFREGLDGAHLDRITGLAEFLPNAFIVGAAKSGTTSLTFALGRHDDVFVTYPKEPKFLSRRYHQGWDWYIDLFKLNSKKASIRIEASTRYSSGQDLNRAVPQMIGTYFPKAKIIYVCRDPMPRMVSQWRHYMSRHPERSDSFADLLSDFDLATYVIGASMYWTQLQGFRRVLPDSQILCLTFEDLLSAPDASLGTILDFLGVDSTREVRKSLLEDDGSFPVKNVAEAKGRRPVPKPDWPDGMWKTVHGWIAPDAKRFLAHIGKPLDYWSGLEGP
jgi:hypothetical protein